MAIFNSRMRFFLPGVFFLVCLCASSTTYSKTIDVAAGANIQTVINAATTLSGDTLRLLGSAYSTTGNLGFGSKRLTLTSVSGNPLNCTITGTNTSNSTFYITSSDAIGSKIMGVTIIGNRNTSGNGGAMNIQTSITVENCIIRNSSALHGGGVHISNNSKPLFRNCIFRNNSANQGGAVYTQDSNTSPTFKNCLFTGHSLTWVAFNTRHGDAIYLNSNPANIVNCTFTANESAYDVICQAASNVPLMILNCIIDTQSTSDYAVNGETNILGTAPYPSIANSYVRGNYDHLADGIAMIYEPSQVQISDGAYESYPNSYVTTSSFNLGFQETTNYHLAMTSSAIGLGANGTAEDYEEEPRPYYLGTRADIGADQFNFGYLVQNSLMAGSHWMDVALVAGEQQISNDLATGTKFHSGKVRFYRITPAVSGVIRLWSEGATADIKAILATDFIGDEIVGADDSSGGGFDFHIDYIYAQAGVSYYLGVINKSGSAGIFDLYGEIETDTVANSCDIADTAAPIVFDTTYFGPGYSDQDVYSDIDFDDDEDSFRLNFAGPGTLVITSKVDLNGDVYGHTDPDFLEAVIKNTGCETVAENTGSDSFLIIYPNPDAHACYLHVDRSRNENTGGILNYGFDIRYYPLDENDPREIVLGGGVGNQSGAITIPGDRDNYYVDIPSAGVITARTSGCTVDAKSKIDIYNPLNEKIVDNGTTDDDTPSGDYLITAAMVGDTTETPFFVVPGRYYVRVSALNSHTTPFEYDLTMTFVASSDDHADYRQLATFLSPWKSISQEDPRLYYYPADGQIGTASEVDFFRIDVPYKASVDIMSDHAASSGPVPARLLDYRGNVLETRDDIRIANPDYTGTSPEWDSAAGYLVNAVVQYPAGNYYRCIQAASGDAQSPINPSYWQPVGVPLPWGGRLTRKLDPGIYYLEISGGLNLAYRVSVDLDDFGDNWTDPQPPKLNSAFNSIIGHLETAANPCLPYSGDADAFELEVTEANTFRIYTTGTSNTYGIIKYLAVGANTPGTPVTGWAGYADEDYDDYGNFLINNIPLEAGTYSVELALTIPDGASPSTGDYVIHFEQNDDYCNETACPGGIPPVGALSSVSGTQSGVIESPGDIDYFTVTPSAGGRLTVTVADASLSLILNLMDQSDSGLTHASSGTLEFDVTAGQLYYLNVKPEFTLNTGSYTFAYHVEDYAGTDNDGASGSTGNDFADARPLALGTTAPSTVSYTECGIDLAGDYDYYSFSVTGPGILKIYSTGATDTYGYLFLETGGMYNLMMSNDDSAYDRTDGYNFGMIYYVAAAGTQTFFVKVRGYSPQEVGDYQLHIEYSSGSDDHGDECGNATLANRDTALWDGGSIIFDEASIGFVASNIGITGDTDFFKFVAGPTATDKGSLLIYSTDGSEPLDTFGYLKNYMCGTIAMNDNGSDISDGLNFRIPYSPTNCVIGADADCTPGVDCECIPQTYYATVRSYDSVATGTYDLHIESNGAFVNPVSTTTMDMTGGGIRYFGFETPSHQTYLTASVTGTFDVSSLRATLIKGDGSIVAGQQDVPFPVFVDGVSRGLHYIKVTNLNASSAGEFDLELNCAFAGTIGYGDGDGSFTMDDGTVTLSATGSDYWLAADQGYFVYYKIEEGVEFIANVRFSGGYQEQYSKAGLMIREDIRNAGARNVASLLMRNADTTYSTRTQYRTVAAGATTTSADTNVGNVSAGGCYIRLHYDSDNNQVITGYSVDGTTWSGDYAVSITLTPPLYVGFAVSSHEPGQFSEVEFTNIQSIVLPAVEE